MNHPRLRPPARRRLATPRASSSASGWFADRLGYSNADASRIAARIQPHFRERLEWRGADATCQRVQNELDLSDRELRSIVTRWPLLVGLSFDDVVLPSLAALRALVGDELDLKSVVLGWPAALGMRLGVDLAAAAAAPAAATAAPAAPAPPTPRSRPPPPSPAPAPPPTPPPRSPPRRAGRPAFAHAGGPPRAEPAFAADRPPPPPRASRTPRAAAAACCRPRVLPKHGGEPGYRAPGATAFPDVGAGGEPPLRLQGAAAAGAPGAERIAALFSPREPQPAAAAAAAVGSAVAAVRAVATPPGRRRRALHVAARHAAVAAGLVEAAVARRRCAAAGAGGGGGAFGGLNRGARCAAAAAAAMEPMPALRPEVTRVH